jgi:hypothetical protein
MPLPLILLGAGLVGAAITAGHLKEKAKANESKRLTLGDLQCHDEDKNGAVKWPSEISTSTVTVKPIPGSIVCCSVFSAFDHTGIWMQNNMIVELHGTGLIKAVSPQRFLNNRSGNTLFVACDSLAKPLLVEGTVQRASEQIYNYWDYDMLKNNCHRFSWLCVTGEDKKISSFTEFNNALAKHHQRKVYWDAALLG